MNRIPIWTKRPTEVANLFNPAYCSMLINSMCNGYQTALPEGVPYPLVFVAMSVVMYPDSARLLPTTSNTKLHIWLQKNPEVLFNFAERTKKLAPYVRESIAFGLSHGVIQLAPNARIVALPVRGLGQRASLDAAVKHSQLVGKILGKINDVQSVFSMFGVRP
jgi:Family of unknown function (DUF6521)